MGDVTANHPAVLGLDHRTPVSKALEVLEDVEIQSVAVYGPVNSFVGAGGVEIVAEDKQYVGETLQHSDDLYFHVLVH